MKFVDNYIKPWFFETDSSAIKPIKVSITVFIVLIIISVIDKIIDPKRMSDVFVLGLVGNLGILIGADVWRRNGKDKYQTGQNGVTPDTTEQKI